MCRGQSLKCGAPKIAKLVYNLVNYRFIHIIIVNITILFMGFSSQQRNEQNYGAPHCREIAFKDVIEDCTTYTILYHGTHDNSFCQIVPVACMFLVRAPVRGRAFITFFRFLRDGVGWGGGV